MKAATKKGKTPATKATATTPTEGKATLDPTPEELPILAALEGLPEASRKALGKAISLLSSLGCEEIEKQGKAIEDKVRTSKEKKLKEEIKAIFRPLGDDGTTPRTLRDAVSELTVREDLLDWTISSALAAIRFTGTGSGAKGKESIPNRAAANLARNGILTGETAVFPTDPRCLGKKVGPNAHKAMREAVEAGVLCSEPNHQGDPDDSWKVNETKYYAPSPETK